MSGLHGMSALITGASSGIGRAIAAELARRGCSLVLVGRSESDLTALADELHQHDGPRHDWMTADLSLPQDVERLSARLADTGCPVDVLVHSAGVGLPPGGYLGNPLSASESMTRIAVDAVSALTHAALPGMLERGRGGVLMVSSIAAFLPGSPAVTYAASKAWVQTFGEGLHQLTRGTGVTSTVVAPGFVRSGFHRRAGLGASGIHEPMWCTPEQVAAAALRGFEHRRALVVPGAIWKTVYALYRLTPRSWTRAGFARYMAWTARRAS